MNVCRIILQKMKEPLAPEGKFVFAVDTVFGRCDEDSEYKVSVSVKTKEGTATKGKYGFSNTFVPLWRDGKVFKGVWI